MQFRVEWPEIKLPKCKKNLLTAGLYPEPLGELTALPQIPKLDSKGGDGLRWKGKGQGMERRERKGCRREVVRKKRDGKGEEGRGQKRQGKGLSPSNIVPPLVKTIAFNY